jgi:hypothetical protein
MVRVQHEHEPESTQDSPLNQKGILEAELEYLDSQGTQDEAEDHAKGHCHVVERNPHGLGRSWGHQVDPHGRVDDGYNL